MTTIEQAIREAEKCRQCGKPHKPWDEPFRGPHAAPTWKDPADGHAYVSGSRASSSRS